MISKDPSNSQLLRCLKIHAGLLIREEAKREHLGEKKTILKSLCREKSNHLLLGVHQRTGAVKQ
jgi:hypothetical protein